MATKKPNLWRQEVKSRAILITRMVVRCRSVQSQHFDTGNLFAIGMPVKNHVAVKAEDLGPGAIIRLQEYSVNDSLEPNYQLSPGNPCHASF
jgi:hypothetical protein